MPQREYERANSVTSCPNGRSGTDRQASGTASQQTRSALPPGIAVFERGWLSSNNVLFHGPGRTALVDSGYATHSLQTIALLRDTLGQRPLGALLNTHLHSDHCGGNAAVQAAYPQAFTWIPPGLAAHVRKWDPVALSHEPTGQQCPPFRVDGLLEPGGVIELGCWTWQVHPAPGHDPHSVVLFEPGERLLISADALWASGFGVVFQALEGQEAFSDVDATFDLIESLGPRLVIPGHGRIFTDVRAALRAARSKLANFRQDPTRHAAHAAKVLLKFKLLELQRVHQSELRRWAARTAFISLIQSRWFPGVPFDTVLDQWIAALLRAGAARQDGEWLING